MSDNILIPTPIAPARPITTPIGTTTPMTYSIGGQSGSGVIDSQGNIFDGSGNVVQTGAGNASSNPLGTYTDMLGREATLDNPFTATTTPGVASNVVSTAAQMATRSIFGISLVDAVAIAVGLILIIGALYTFSGTKDIITTATKAAVAAA